MKPFQRHIVCALLTLPMAWMYILKAYYDVYQRGIGDFYDFCAEPTIGTVFVYSIFFFVYIPLVEDPGKRRAVVDVTVLNYTASAFSTLLWLLSTPGTFSPFLGWCVLFLGFYLLVRLWQWTHEPSQVA